MKTIFVVEGASSPPNRPARRGLPAQACLVGPPALDKSEKITMIDGCVDKLLWWSIFLVGDGNGLESVINALFCFHTNAFADLNPV